MDHNHSISVIKERISSLEGEARGLRVALNLLEGISAEASQESAKAPDVDIVKLKGGKDPVYDSVCAYLRQRFNKTSRMKEICEFLVENGLSKSKGSSAILVHNRMRRADNKIKRIGPGLYKLFE